MPEGIISRIATFGGLSFTVNTAVTDVALILTGTPDLSINNTIMNIASGENAIIEGFGLTLPYQFGQGKLDENSMIQLGWRDNSGNNAAVSEIGDTGRLNIPDTNVWYETSVYVPFPATAAARWHFEIRGVELFISQINAPAALHEVELLAQFHLQIRHTTALIG